MSGCCGGRRRQSPSQPSSPPPTDPRSTGSPGPLECTAAGDILVSRDGGGRVGAARFESFSQGSPVATKSSTLPAAHQHMAPTSFHYFSYAELATATRNFSDTLVLGEGGFGRVYKGRLQNGMHVAVKRLDRRGQQGDAEFNVEVHLLSRLRHPHLVRLVGVCVEGSHRAAVFELMLGGCLRTALDAGPTRGVPSSAAKPLPRHPLTWLARLNIALGAAAGLAFLHEEARPSIVHRDVKSSNILLDEVDRPCIGDLGLARSTDVVQQCDADVHMASIALKGEYGYVAPETLCTGRHSQKSDVYAFGIVLLELFTGQQALEPSRRNDPKLVDHVLPHLCSMEAMQAYMDPVIQHEPKSALQLASFIEVTSACLHSKPQERPCMSQIRSELQAVVGCRDALLAPVPPSGSRLASPAAASAAPGSAPAHDVCQLADLIPLDIADASGASGTQAPVASTGPTPLEHPDGQGRQHAVHDVGPLANPLWQVTPMQPAAAHLPAPACPTPAPPSPGQAAVAGSRSHATTGNPFSQGWSSTRPSPSASIPGSAWNLGPGLPHLCSANPSTCSLLELPPAHPSSLDAWAPANLPLPTTGYPGCERL